MGRKVSYGAGLPPVDQPHKRHVAKCMGLCHVSKRTAEMRYAEYLTIVLGLPNRYWENYKIALS